MSEILDKTKKEYWESLKTGSIIKINDTQTMLESIEKGEGVRGIDFVIKGKRYIKEVNDLCSWLFFSLNEEENLFIVVKIVDDLIDTFIYFQPPDFTPGTRKELVQHDFSFLFLEPKNDDYLTDYNLLKFTEIIIINEYEYTIKSQGILLGQEGDNLYTVVEFQCNKEVENPELLLLEVGESEEGGCVILLMGTKVQLNELDILPV